MSHIIRDYDPREYSDDDMDSFIPGNYAADSHKHEDVRLFSEIKDFLLKVERNWNTSPELCRGARDLLNKLKDR